MKKCFSCRWGRRGARRVRPTEGFVIHGPPRSSRSDLSPPDKGGFGRSPRLREQRMGLLKSLRAHASSTQFCVDLEHNFLSFDLERNYLCRPRAQMFALNSSTNSVMHGIILFAKRLEPPRQGRGGGRRVDGGDGRGRSPRRAESRVGGRGRRSPCSLCVPTSSTNVFVCRPRAQMFALNSSTNSVMHGIILFAKRLGKGGAAGGGWGRRARALAAEGGVAGWRARAALAV